MTLFIVELQLEVTHKPSACPGCEQGPDHRHDDAEDGPRSTCCAHAPHPITLHPITRVVSAADARAAGHEVLDKEFARLSSDDPSESYALEWQLTVRQATEAARA